MFSREFIEKGIHVLVDHGAEVLLQIMVIMFVFQMVFRALIYFTVSMNEWFVREFEKRVDRHFAETPRGSFSFFVVTKKLLEKTFYEAFEIRAIMKRRRPDFIMPISDRVFFVKQGAAWVVRDTLRHVRHLRRNEAPGMFNIAKSTLQRNPCFNKVFGLIPASETNSMLNILPGLFVVFGIFGTFMGITKALPDLSQMNLANVEGSKALMDGFLLKTAHAMNASICGIFLSVVSSLFNAYFSPEKVFGRTVDRYESILALLWSRSDSNELPEDLPHFDENRDAIEALAEQSLEKTLAPKKKGFFKSKEDDARIKKAS
jgi:hypothetical protein